jgi:hypothetical protein
MCTECHGPITGEPVVADEQVTNLGYAKATKWCSTDCRENAGERRAQQT